MPRKPTGRRRGRPHGSRQYPGDDRLCIEMARLILTGEVPDAKVAARRLAPLADGTHTLDKSKAKRLERAYGRREDWFLFRAKAPSTERGRPRQNGPLFLTAYNDAVQSFLESQRRFESAAQIVAKSPFIEEARRIEERQRMLDNMLKGPFG
jgi:hypothetical protein